MYIWIVEDDDLQLEYLAEKLLKELPNATLLKISTEHEFREKLFNLASPYPNLVILDIMLRWTDLTPRMAPIPEEFKEEGYFRAGFRCETLIRKCPPLRDIPVFLYTVLDELDIEDDMTNVISPKTKYIGKNADYNVLMQIKGFCSSS